MPLGTHGVSEAILIVRSCLISVVLRAPDPHYSALPSLSQRVSARPALTRSSPDSKKSHIFKTVLETPLFPDFGDQNAHLEPQGSPKASKMEPKREPKTELFGYQAI